MEQNADGRPIGARADTAPLTPDDDTLRNIKMALACKALENRFFQPLRSFFQRMDLEWGETPTAMAHLRKGQPVITLGRDFFAKNVQLVGEGAEIVLHEINHHLFGHLDPGQCAYDKKYSHDVVHAAQDALINAYSAKVKCAGFMKRYYPDEGLYAFLRPDSVNLAPIGYHDKESDQTEVAPAMANQNKGSKTAGEVATPSNNHREQATTPIKIPSQDGIGEADPLPWSDGLLNSQAMPSYEDRLERSKFLSPGTFPDFVGTYRFSGLPLGSQVPAKPNSVQGCKSFYYRLQTLSTTLEETLEFFNEYLSNTENTEGHSKPSLLGDHDSFNFVRQQALRDNIFRAEEAYSILRSMGVIRVSQKARNNFRQVIRSIVQKARREGNMRVATRLSRRMPAKITNQDIIRLEQGREKFTRPTFSARDYDIFFDVSGSVDAYIPFVSALVRSLSQSDRPARCYVWADRVASVPADRIGTEEEPDVGGGTNGEAVAKFIADNGISRAVVITDNDAGKIETPIQAPVILCLLPNAKESGSFLEKSAVPLCTIHKLMVDGYSDGDDDDEYDRHSQIPQYLGGIDATLWLR